MKLGLVLGLVWAASAVGAGPKAEASDDDVTESDGKLMKRIAKELATPLNPIVTDFSRELTFHLDFDDGTVQPAVGKTTIPREKRDNFRMVKSELGGQALVNGQFGYPQDPSAPLLDTSKPGTVICWVKLNREQQPVVRGLQKWECGSTFFDVIGPGGTQFLIMKSSSMEWGRGTMTFYVNWKDIGGKLKTASVAARASFVDWKVGEWKMVAAAWTAEKLYVSVDGKPFNAAPLAEPLRRYAGPVYVTATYWVDAKPKSKTEPGLFTVDEVSILNRKLTDDEIKSVYDKMSARLRRPTKLRVHRSF